ncbi:hypothetical protein [Streptomyces rochei]|uniref:hypothetical protein n=1 Tax=Streptomyces rochei TaxID=1928 RepID=UPI003530E3B8
MTDPLPIVPAAWFSALQGLMTGSYPRKTAVQPVQDVDFILATNMLSHGVDLDRVGALNLASSRLSDLGQFLALQAKDYSNSPRPEDVARLLLRTAEETLGLPSGTSGLLHGLAAAPPPAQQYVADGQHRLAGLESIVWHSAGSGKTATVIIDLIDQFSHQLDGLSRSGHVPNWAELRHLADAASALSGLLLVLAQRLLMGGGKFFDHLVAVPPNESSPCGVLRLAVPCVPRAPGEGPVPGPTEFALAA